MFCPQVTETKTYRLSILFQDLENNNDYVLYF